ncbi:A disintegrin and metalloproteinase with thrombospondin motifs 20-like [Haliotis rufescens]|uniref:A disintegrin and metalloproteinase with thrombospondin motifs 20-like n=1 Tax=Haliotis rufescens TaxID=6454 RepID=UPI001EB05A2E|nr:A disintegrin and metalloproteinase with thrombospondin motifs 20-like [Haliotis rufescens]
MRNQTGNYVWAVCLVVLHGLNLLDLTVAAEKMCTDNVPSVKRGVKLVNAQILSTNASGLMVCARYCLGKKYCESFNYNEGQNQCDLNYKSSDSTDANMESISSFLFSDIQHWPQRLAAMCTNHVCPLNTICIPAGEPVCEVSGCLTSHLHAIPNAVLNTTVSARELPIGTTVKYVCESDFYPEASASCGLSGNWSFTDCRLAVPSSCREVKQCAPTSGDGEYWIRLPNFDFYRTRVYCNNMSSGNPKEYLTLKYKNYGIFPNKTNKVCQGETNLYPTCEGRDGEVWYSKIRVHPVTMHVIVDDTTYANISQTPPRYGYAKDCYAKHEDFNVSSCGAKGEFTIDLRGTGWIVSPEQQWKLTGYKSALETLSRSAEGAVIHIKCGGFGGGCVPNGTLSLVPNVLDNITESSADRYQCN